MCQRFWSEEVMKWYIIKRYSKDLKQWNVPCEFTTATIYLAIYTYSEYIARFYYLRELRRIKHKQCIMRTKSYISSPELNDNKENLSQANDCWPRGHGQSVIIQHEMCAFGSICQNRPFVDTVSVCTKKWDFVLGLMVEEIVLNFAEFVELSLSDLRVIIYIYNYNIITF